MSVGKTILLFSPLEAFLVGLKSLLLEISPNSKIESLGMSANCHEREFSLGAFHLTSYIDFLKVQEFYTKSDFPAVFFCRAFNAAMLEKIFERDNSVVFKEDLTAEEIKGVFKTVLNLGRAKPDDLRDRLPFTSEKMINIESLTAREKEILYLLARGMTTYSISLCLNISVHTVRNHVNRIYTKLKVSDKVSAVMKAISLGLLKDFFWESEQDKENLFDI